MLNVYSAAIWISSIVIASFGVILFLMNDKRSSRSLVAISGAIAFWTASVGGVFWASTPEIARAFMAASNLGGSLIALSVYFFCHFVHTELLSFPRNRLALIAAIQLLFTYGYFGTTFFTKEILFTSDDSLARIIVDGPLLPLHYLYIGSLLLAGFLALQSKKDAHAEEDHGHSRNIIRAFGIAFIPTAAILIISRAFGNTHYYWLAPITALSWIPATSYSLVKFKVVPFRLFIGQVAVLALSTILFANIFVGENVFGAGGRLLVFLSFEIIGLFFIYLLTKNDRQSAYLTQLTKELRSANERLSTVNKKLQDLDAQRSKFVSIGTHQLRAPLTAIIGYSSMLLEGSFGKMPKKAEVATDKIFRSGRNLMDVINDFLDLSTLEMGQMHFAFAPVDLGTIALGVAQELQANVQMAGLDLRLVIPHSDSFWVTGDKDKLRHVIVNLIDNAIRYTPKGHVELAITRKKDRIVLMVSDSGIGISSEGIKKLFARFSRAENASQVNAEGVGLGLYLASEIMKAHKGTIRAESGGVGKGAQLIIELPAIARPSK